MNRPGVRYELSRCGRVAGRAFVGRLHRTSPRGGKARPAEGLAPPLGGGDGNSYRVDPYIAAAAALQAEPKTTADTLKTFVGDAGERDAGEGPREVSGNRSNVGE